MGIKWSDTIWSDRLLHGSPRALMLALANKCFDHSSSLEISFEKLAWLMNLKSTKQIKRLLDYLKQQKYITYVSGDGRGKATTITFLFPQIKVDIFDDKGGHFETEKVDIFEQEQNKGGHFGEIKVDIFDDKGGHFGSSPPTPPYKDLIPPFTTEDITTHTAHNTKRAAVSVDNNGKSRFSLAECLRYVQICVSEGENIKNPKGLASSLFQSGNSDAFILAALYPEQTKELEREKYGEPLRFSNEPCSVCFGAKLANPDGKGHRKCPNCIDEKGNATGFEGLEQFRQKALDFLKKLEIDDDFRNYQKFYTTEDWQWLIQQLNKQAAAN